MSITPGSNNMYVRKGYAKQENHGSWRGDGATYSAFHTWLKINFGKASLCENESCKGKSKNFEWALLKGEEHGHYRERYKQMCKSCHRIYDGVNRK